MKEKYTLHLADGRCFSEIGVSYSDVLHKIGAKYWVRAEDVLFYEREMVENDEMQLKLIGW